jgi:hypothetical protein
MSKLLEALHRLLPGSESIRSEFYLTADPVIEAVEAAQLTIPMTRMWNVEQQDDDEIAEIVFRDRWKFHDGLVLIHSPACSRHKLEDFSCPASELKKFIHDYDVEMLFDGDVLFLAPESGTLTVFHHEGAFGHANLLTSRT